MNTTTSTVFDELKLKAATASLKALDTLTAVLDDPEARNVDKIKAANQIIAIMDKAIDHLDIIAKYNEMKEQLDHISDTSVYDPQV